MSHQTAATVAHTIGIDTGKNTLHLIGLDEGRNRFAGEDCPRSDHGPARQYAAVPDRNRSWHGDALCGSRAKCARPSASPAPRRGSGYRRKLHFIGRSWHVSHWRLLCRRKRK